jgi:hypothetical protein
LVFSLYFPFHTPTVLGYLLGPTLGASLFSLTHRSIFRGNPAPFEVMDRAFFEHIKRNRVSPVFQSVNNPSPDYYGEKVSAGRRPWRVTGATGAIGATGARELAGRS